MSQTDSSDSSQGSQLTSSSQDSVYGISSQKSSQEVEDNANWGARQLLSDITEEPQEAKSHQGLLEVKGKDTNVHALRVAKLPGLITVQGKKNHEIIKKRASRRREPANTRQEPQVGGAVAEGDTKCSLCGHEDCQCDNEDKPEEGKGNGGCRENQ
jgi:hypothetical protein